MKIALVLVVIIGIVALISTIFAAGRVETEYGRSTKQNITNLTMMYVILFIVLSAGIVWYVVSER